jgi:hypothetical protein
MEGEGRLQARCRQRRRIRDTRVVELEAYQATLVHSRVAIALCTGRQFLSLLWLGVNRPPVSAQAVTPSASSLADRCGRNLHLLLQHALFGGPSDSATCLL